MEQAAAALVEVPGTAQVRGGAGGVGDFARQGGLKDHPQFDGVLAVADGGRHQFADHEFGGEGQFFQPSGGSVDRMAWTRAVETTAGSLGRPQVAT
ncbi:hypothetical protein [Streptomyces flavovariabilis]|uniref:hypothetical protein n=1 Tax=Streptomyces flavovariabilis TaxID=284031 RepID=UPI0012FF11C4